VRGEGGGEGRGREGGERERGEGIGPPNVEDALTPLTTSFSTDDQLNKRWCNRTPAI
jgi:hypothetical protein